MVEAAGLSTRPGARRGARHSRRRALRPYAAEARSAAFGAGDRMIIVRVELHSAATRKVTEIARMRICNIGGTRERGDYRAETFRGRSAQQLARLIRQRAATISDYPRL